MAKEIKNSIPANVEAERTILGAMLIDKSACALGTTALTADIFSGLDPRNILVFNAMLNLDKRKEIIDPETVANELINLKTFEDAGGTNYLQELLESVVNPDNTDHYIHLIKDQAVLRDFLKKIDVIKRDVDAGKASDIGDFLTVACQELDQIAGRRQVGDFREIKEVGEAVRKTLELEAGRAHNGLTGVDTGFTQLNRYTHGWQKGDLIILAARPSVGKTALALNFILNAAEHQGKAVAFFSCEMGADKIMQRLIASRAKVNSENISTGQLYGRDKELVDQAITTIGENKIFIDDSPRPSLGDLVAKARKLKAKEPNLSLIVIDYLNLINVGGHYDSRTLEIAAITSGLKELARSLKVPVIALAQLNRDVDKNDGKVPMLSNLKESGAIEQDADIVLLMYRKDYYAGLGETDIKDAKFAKSEYSQALKADVAKNADSASSKKGGISVVDVSVAKNRNGQTGSFVLLFSKNYSLFDNSQLSSSSAVTYGPAIDPDED